MSTRGHIPGELRLQKGGTAMGQCASPVQTVTHLGTSRAGTHLQGVGLHSDVCQSTPVTHRASPGEGH